MIQDFTADGVLAIRHSESESHRFGFSVARLLVPVGQSCSDDAVIALVRESACALLIVRAEAARTGLFHELRGLGDFECLLADTLYYYHWAVASTTSDSQRQTELKIEYGAEWADIKSVLTESFLEYKNHYSMNPRLSLGVTLIAYEEWAAALLQDPQSVALVARDCATGDAAGFILMTLDETRAIAEIALNAVHPDAQRGGVYSSLMQSAREYLERETDIRDLYISTQIENKVVIAAWEKLGLTPHLNLQTFHLMRRSAFGGATTR